MKSFHVRIRVGFKDGILDPQAEAILSSLKKLDFKSVENVSVEKVFQIKVSAETEAQAVQLGRDMANQLLANVVMENFDVEVVQ